MVDGRGWTVVVVKYFFFTNIHVVLSEGLDREWRQNIWTGDLRPFGIGNERRGEESREEKRWEERGFVSNFRSLILSVCALCHPFL